MGEHDGILLNRWSATGDQQAFMELVNRYQGMVFGVCARILKDPAKAEDLVQECFLKLTSTRPKKIRTLGPWLHRVATNAALNQLTSDQRRRARELNYATESDGGTVHGIDDINEILDEELNALAPKTREVIIAHFLQGHTQVEVAARLGITPQAVRNRIRRGLDVLRGKMTARGVSVSAATFASLLTSSMAGAVPPRVAEAMGKAVLRGAFVPEATGTALISKLISAAVAGIFLAGGIAMFTTGDSPEPVDAESIMVVQQMTVADPESSQPLLVASQQSTSERADDASPELVEHSVDEGIIRLQCVSYSGDPIAGAEVYVFQKRTAPTGTGWALDPAKRPSRTAGPLISDAEGYVQFTAFGASDVADVQRYAYASGPGESVGGWFESTNVEHRRNNQAKLIYMCETESVSGRVTIPMNVDIATVRVEVMTVELPRPDESFGTLFGRYLIGDPTIFPKLLTPTIDGMGNFEITGMPAECSYTVRAYAPGLGERQKRVLNSQQVDFVELDLKPEGVIEGTVLYEGSRNPVAGQLVFARTHSNGGLANNHMATTDEMGTYRITGLAAGEYTVLPGNKTHPPTYLAQPQTSVNVETGFVTDNVDFVFEEGVLVRGTILSSQTGEPIPNTYISALSRLGLGEVMNSAVSDSEGNYEMRLPAGGNILMVTRVPNEFNHPNKQGRRDITIKSHVPYLKSEEFLLNPRPQEPKPVGNTYITGYVADASGQPASGVMISGERDYYEGDDRRMIGPIRIGKTDRHGRFAVKVEGNGKHLIIVGGNEWSAHRGQWVHVNGGITVAIPDTKVRRFTGELTLRVLDESGDPLPDIKYHVSAEELYKSWNPRSTGTEGTALIEHLPQSEIVVTTIDSPIYENYSWSGLPGQHVEIVLKQK